jgi:integrase
MAKLERISFIPHAAEVKSKKVVWTPVSKSSKALPQVCWADGSPWREVNLWLRSRSPDCKFETLESNAVALVAYASWLETERLSWGHFPRDSAKRCLNRYRGVLMNAIRARELATSTAAARMRVLVQFYRWVQNEDLISVEVPLWRDIEFGIRVPDRFGFEKTISVTTTNLQIKNRKTEVASLEDGLLPLLQKDVDQLLEVARNEASEELELMLKLGFGTGMRVGSIADLKVANLESAVAEPGMDGLVYRIALGPDAEPPVHTKYDTSGRIYISKSLLDELHAYRSSARRIERVDRASRSNKNLVFLTRFGRHYVRDDETRSSAINVEMHRLRASARSVGVDLDSFYFHRTRPTFGTNFIRLVMRAGFDNPVDMLKEAMLHRAEATSMRYVKFIENEPKKAILANEFSRLFMGLVPGTSS